MGAVVDIVEGGLGITMRREADSVVVRLKGHSTVDSSPDLRDCLVKVLSARPRFVTVDLTNVTYLEASGIATLIEALKTARHRGVELCLIGLNDSVRQLLEVTGVLGLFELSNSGKKLS